MQSTTAFLRSQRKSSLVALCWVAAFWGTTSWANTPGADANLARLTITRDFRLGEAHGMPLAEPPKGWKSERPITRKRMPPSGRYA